MAISCRFSFFVALDFLSLKNGNFIMNRQRDKKNEHTYKRQLFSDRVGDFETKLQLES